MLNVNQLFEYTGVQRGGAVPWGAKVPLDQPGVYVVATTPDGEDSAGFETCPLDSSAIDKLIVARPEATVDGRAATAQTIGARLADMWVTGSSIIYIGLAGTNVRKRVQQFYSTAIGARTPHAGGWPVKMLDSTKLWVHYGATNNPGGVELAMVQSYVSSLPDEVRVRLIDQHLPLPFANLAVPNGPRKRHGFAGVKEPRITTPVKPGDPSKPAPVVADSVVVPEGEIMGKIRFTQNVTAGDIERGALRVPKVSKDIFPAEGAKIRVNVGSQWHVATWNPGIGVDKERSGTVYLGKGKLEGIVPIGRPRRVVALVDGYLIE